jgi:uncharacterized membrane protein YfcA
VLAVTFGLLIGLVMGLTGAGGGVLAVPALALGLGWPMVQAAPVALMAVGAAAAVGALDGLRKGLVRYRAALLRAALGGLFTPLGAHLARQLPEAGLRSLFCAVLVLVALRMVRQAWGAPSQVAEHGWQRKNCQLDPGTGRLRWTPRCALTLATLGGCCGLLTGLLGVGGGFVLVPAFQQLSDIRLHGIVATSLLVIALVSGMAIVGALHAGVTIPAAGGGFIGASVVGMLIGRTAAPHVPARGLQWGFAGLCVGVASLLLFKTWG